MSILDDIKFAIQVIEDSKRVLLCHPSKQLLAEAAMADAPHITVKPHPWLPEDVVYLCDPNAVEVANPLIGWRTW